MTTSRRDFIAIGTMGTLASALPLNGDQTPAPPQNQQTPGAPPAFGTAQPVGPEVNASTFAEAEKLMADAQVLTLYRGRRGPHQYALGFAGLGEKDQTIAQLEGMANLGPVLLGRILTYPEFTLVRGDPHWK